MRKKVLQKFKDLIDRKKLVLFDEFQNETSLQMVEDQNKLTLYIWKEINEEQLCLEKVNDMDWRTIFKFLNEGVTQ